MHTSSFSCELDFTDSAICLQLPRAVVMDALARGVAASQRARSGD
jgi:hypothetical protein